MAVSVLIAPNVSVELAASLLSKPPLATVRLARYRFALRGRRPLLVDRMTEEQILGLITKKKVDFPVDEDLAVKAERKLYAASYDKCGMPVGPPVMPATNLYAMLRGGGISVQFGQGRYDKVSKAGGATNLPYMLQLVEPYFPILGFDGNPAKWVVDTRKGNATQGEGAVGIIRPRFDEWAIIGHFDLDVDALGPDAAQKLFLEGGRKKGLCSGRPEKGLDFGICELTDFTWLSGAEPRKSTARSNGDAAPRGRKKAAANGEPVNRLEEIEDDEASGDDELDTNGDGTGEEEIITTRSGRTPMKNGGPFKPKSRNPGRRKR